MSLRHQWVQHRTQPAHSRKLITGPPAALDRNHHRDRLPFRRFIKMHDLLHAIVLDDKIFRIESIHNLTLRALHQRGNHHHIRLTMESCFLANSAAAQRRQPEQKKMNSCPPPAILPCGWGFRATLHPAHRPINGPVSGNRSPHAPAFVAEGDTHRQYSAPPAPPDAPYRWCWSPGPRPASLSLHTRPASECIPDPIPAGYTPDQKSRPARFRFAPASTSNP